MGKKNKRHLLSQIAQSEPQVAKRICDWCRNPQEQLERWESQWVCNDCFPREALNRCKENIRQHQVELLAVRQCDSCRSKSKAGTVILGKWVCSTCYNKVSGNVSGNKKHKNKYAQFSHVDHADIGCVVLSKPKPKRKKKPKLRKVTYWTVIITDISDGKL